MALAALCCQQRLDICLEQYLCRLAMRSDHRDAEDQICKGKAEQHWKTLVKAGCEQRERDWREVSNQHHRGS